MCLLPSAYHTALPSQPAPVPPFTLSLAPPKPIRSPIFQSPPDVPSTFDQGPPTPVVSPVWVGSPSSPVVLAPSLPAYCPAPPPPCTGSASASATASVRGSDYITSKRMKLDLCRLCVCASVLHHLCLHDTCNADTCEFLWEQCVRPVQRFPRMEAHPAT